MWTVDHWDIPLISRAGPSDFEFYCLTSTIDEGNMWMLLCMEVRGCVNVCARESVRNGIWRLCGVV